MIKIENTVTPSPEQWRAVINGARNPLNSWDRSDSNYNEGFVLGEADEKLLARLVKAGPEHGKFTRMLSVWVDVTAPLYWWKEFDTYKVGTVANSCSTMHTIHKKRYERDDFSIEHLENCGEEHWLICMDNIISSLNVAREKYLETKDKKYWWQMIQLLPTSYNQHRTVQLNYAALRNIYRQRQGHKLDEWHEFCHWIETLPYAKELITAEVA